VCRIPEGANLRVVHRRQVQEHSLGHLRRRREIASRECSKGEIPTKSLAWGSNSSALDPSMCVEHIDRWRLVKLQPVESVVASMAPGEFSRPRPTVAHARVGLTNLSHEWASRYRTAVFTPEGGNRRSQIAAAGARRRGVASSTRLRNGPRQGLRVRGCRCRQVERICCKPDVTTAGTAVWHDSLNIRPNQTMRQSRLHLWS
jgi:hypothetical protein